MHSQPKLAKLNHNFSTPEIAGTGMLSHTDINHNHKVPPPDS